MKALLSSLRGSAAAEGFPRVEIKIAAADSAALVAAAEAGFIPSGALTSMQETAVYLAAATETAESSSPPLQYIVQRGRV